MPRLDAILPALLAGALAVAAGPAWADGGVSASQSAQGLAIVIDVDQANVHFNCENACNVVPLRGGFRAEG
jgi:hypothetical protein